VPSVDTAAAPVSILIADDHPIFREGLKKLLEAESSFRVVGEAEDGGQAVQLTRSLKPDVLLLDLSMPRVPGLEALRELGGQEGAVRCILLTAAIDRSQLVTALQLGARGIVLKEAATQLLFKCIDRVMAGEYWVGRGGVSDLVEALRDLTPQTTGPAASDRPFGLTKREREVLGTIVAGYTNKEIAKSLTLSEDTVKHHITNIFNKLGVSNRLELALFAVHHKLVDDV
jgi:DNA-binding NarL/FixJ family response regulator